jgi:hypothetical protein
VLGGYGYDSITDTKRTFSTLTALDVDGLIAEIISGGNDLMPHVRQITDTIFCVTGGKLELIGITCYLAGGQNFSGLYTKMNAGFFVQHYMNSISHFELIDDGATLSYSNYGSSIDTVNFHRRDLNTAPWISPAGEEGFAVYGGVFRYGQNIPYQNPIYVLEGSTTIDFSFEQKMSQYACPVIPMFDSLQQTMYTLFAGGESLYDFNEDSNLLTLDTLVPFINDISTVIRYADGAVAEVILPTHFNELAGTNAEFFPNTALARYSNGVFKLRTFTSSVMLGYIYGGIVSAAANDGNTWASNKVYRVLLHPDFGTGIYSLRNQDLFHLFPNPCSEVSQLVLGSAFQGDTEISVCDAFHQEVLKITVPKGKFTSQNLSIPTAHFPAGIYSVILRSNAASCVKRLIVLR